jgi:hypothetical protein
MNDKGAGHPDVRAVEFDDPNEIAYWIKFFDTTRDELYAAISVVGTSAQAIKDHLHAKSITAR